MLSDSSGCVEGVGDGGTVVGVAGCSDWLSTRGCGGGVVR